MLSLQCNILSGSVYHAFFIKACIRKRGLRGIDAAVEWLKSSGTIFFINDHLLVG